VQPTDRPVLGPGVEVHAVEDGCVVYVPDGRHVHFLNDTAMHVLEQCDGTVTWDEMQSVFVDRYDVPVPFDVRTTILPELEAAGIIRPEPDN
jgi:hypothetical protein